MTRTRRFAEVLDVLSQHKIPELLIGAMSLVAMGLGVSIMTVPDRFLASPSFAVAFLIPHWIWALAFSMVGVWLAATGLHERRPGTIPACVLAVLLTCWGVALALALPHGGVPSGIVAWIGLGWIAGITALATRTRKSL